MKFKSYRKRITSLFADDSSYRDIVHSGVDWVVGYGQDVLTDNAGYVYKVFYNGTNGWRGVYLLVPNGKEYMEVTIGHLKDIYVKAGQKVTEDQVVGTEGNFGTVFSAGVRITPEMREAGDRRGSHVHEAYRPVREVSERKKGKHYLRTASGRYYKRGGKYLEIIRTDGVRGFVDPMEYDVIKRLKLQLMILKLKLKIKQFLLGKQD